MYIVQEIVGMDCEPITLCRQTEGEPSERACNCWLKSGFIYKNLGLSVYATWTSY
ncbi:MAG: hypothetical protein F6K54_28690 [Okeania sp. SIO3B5]|uniref:hypothetical protein n=1 Tax=Okeania sp. SIO3B5 TaxID=2607811 RepID=UPI0014008C63|nr:hypothetical protein [Okeania sp. SIO3B5]NEO56704.1 hypothetical protein [Okeania sp. SIO3B5]